MAIVYYRKFFFESLRGYLGARWYPIRNECENLVDQSAKMNQNYITQNEIETLKTMSITSLMLIASLSPLLLHHHLHRRAFRAFSTN